MTANKHKRALKRMLDKCRPDRFTLSGPKAKKLDCYEVRIDRNGAPYLSLKSYKNSHIDCLEWIDDHYSKPVSIDFDELDVNKIKIVHYWHGAIITFKNINDYRFHYVFKVVYLRLIFESIVESTNHFFYRKNKLDPPDHMNLLGNIFELTKNSSDGKVSEKLILDKLYSHNWILHSDGMIMLNIVSKLLDSFIDSKWITTIGDDVIITGKGITAFQEYKKNREKFLIKCAIAIFTVTLTGLVTLLK